MKRLYFIIAAMLLAIAASAQNSNNVPDGLDAVDLALPSGTLWANMNVGATAPEGYGDYFAWGETSVQSSNRYFWDSYKWCNGSYKALSKYCSDASFGHNGFTDNMTMLEADDDAATAIWGSGWRMPTSAEMEELVSNTTGRWTTLNGVYGRKFTSKTNGHSIFLPAAGCWYDSKSHGAGSYGAYWSNTINAESPSNAWSFNFGIAYVGKSYFNRLSGFTIRPVSTVRLGVSSSSLTFTSTAGSEQVTITCNDSWTATSNESWCTVSPASGTGDGVLTITATENTNADSRSATVTVTAGALTRTVTVTQSAHVEVEPVDLGRGLVAYYPFNATANDESGYGNHGSIIGNVVLAPDRHGNSNSAYRFPGEPFNYISVPDDETLHCSTFTLSAWVFTDGDDYGDGYLINKGRDITNGSYHLSVGSVGATNLYGGSNVAYVDDIPSVNEWHLITGTVEGDQARYYLDGELLDERTLSNPFSYDNTEPLTLGMHYYTDVPSNWAYSLLGVLDDVRIYNRALNQSEVKALYEGADLEASLSALSLDSSAGSGQVTVHCNGSWTATSSEPWCTVSPTSGTGDVVLTITASENTNYSSRSATVTVTSDTYSWTIIVTQEGKVIDNTLTAVDLGLPSGTLWANMNVGASTPEDYGNYFAWGETTGLNDEKTYFDWSTYKWCEGSQTTMTKYNTQSDYGFEGFVDNKTELDLDDDAAYANMGTTWRLPSNEQCEELVNSDYTTTEWTTLNEVYGCKITSKSNGNSIFLPATGYHLSSSLYDLGTYGYYWSSTLNDGYPYRSWSLRIGSSEASPRARYRSYGFTVRPVRLTEANLELSSSSLSLDSSTGSGQVTIHCNGSWTATSSESWCTVSPASGTGDGVLTITASENTSTNSRSATVTVTAGTFSQTITVTQDGKAISLELSSSSLSLASSAGSGQVAITCNGSWTANSSESWCTVSPASGTGTGVLTITASENTSTNSRSATVTVTAGALTRTVTVTQGGKSSGGTAPAGVEAVDLGLPSGTLWANMNVGAEQPEDYGDYFAWGETTGYGADTNDGHSFDWSTYKWCNGYTNTMTKYCNDSSYGYNGFTDGKTELDLEDDAAYVNWGAAWRMPSKAQIDELRTNCTWTWTTKGTVNGYEVTGANGNSIFLPAVGYRSDSTLNGVGSHGDYWSRALVESGPYHAWDLYFFSSHFDALTYYRCNGQSVRPVRLSEVSLELSSSSLSLASSAGSEQVTITCNGSWTANSSELWCTVSPASGTGDGVLTITASENTSADSRNATVTVTAGALTRTVTVTQGGKSSGGTAPAGVEAVDLGLPSGTLWANMNVGAEQPEDYGDYFAWGETTGYGADTNDGRSFNWASYKWCEGSEHKMTKYCNDSSYGYNGYTDNKTELDPEDDAAYVNWGPNWRMPTYEQFQELDNSNYTTTEWTTQNGVNGRKITSKSNGNSIFLPAAGYRYVSSLSNAGSYGRYWSRTLDESAPSGAGRVYFDSSGVSTGYGIYRYYGQSVRPVRVSE
ncbi:MAG: hypothetical protein IKH22_09310 [Prevotella sp.]|nr:hypothetical protein [Prevotella sp.]